MYGPGRAAAAKIAARFAMNRLTMAGRDGRTPYLGGAGNPVLGARGVNPRTVIG